MCPHTTICVLILLYVSSNYYMCPHPTMCPHTTIVSSYYTYSMTAHLVAQIFGAKRQPSAKGHLPKKKNQIFRRKRMPSDKGRAGFFRKKRKNCRRWSCPIHHSTIYVSSNYVSSVYICPHTTKYMSSYYTWTKACPSTNYTILTKPIPVTNYDTRTKPIPLSTDYAVPAPAVTN